MRENVSREESYVDKYGLRRIEEVKKRLDLNDLLKRAKDQEKSDTKFNVLIYSGAASVLVVLILIFSI